MAFENHPFVGNSKHIAYLRKEVKTVAQARMMHILIEGPSGTGKEVVARNIH